MIARRVPSYSHLFADRTAGTIVHPSQRALSAAIDHTAYIRWWGDISGYDTANPIVRSTKRRGPVGPYMYVGLIV